ncbi:hypothetical protein T484DRAFT_1795654, partial [Baffinella frigidus]
GLLSASSILAAPTPGQQPLRDLEGEKLRADLEELLVVWSERERELSETAAKLNRALATAESALPATSAHQGWKLA